MKLFLLTHNDKETSRMGLILTALSSAVAFVIAVIGVVKNHKPKEGEKSYLGGVNAVGVVLIILSFVALVIGVTSAAAAVYNANEAKQKADDAKLTAENHSRMVTDELKALKITLGTQQSRLEDYHVRAVRRETQIASIANDVKEITKTTSELMYKARSLESPDSLGKEEVIAMIEKTKNLLAGKLQSFTFVIEAKDLDTEIISFRKEIEKREKQLHDAIEARDNLKTRVVAAVLEINKLMEHVIKNNKAGNSFNRLAELEDALKAMMMSAFPNPNP
jgi:multisubunit Na+/H+ antiporter MnhC subunit